MKKQKMMRSLFMAALLFGGIFIAGAENNVYAQTGGLIGSGTRSDDNGTGSTGVTSQTMGSGGRIAEPDSTSEFPWQSVWKLFF